MYILDKAYDDSIDGLFKPSDSKLREILTEFISGFQKTYILIDALDECRDIENVFDFIKALHASGLRQCHLLVTSRKEQHIVESLLSENPMEIDMSQMPVNEDIQRYVDYDVDSSLQLKKWGPEEKALIRKVLVEKAKGM